MTASRAVAPLPLLARRRVLEQTFGTELAALLASHAHCCRLLRHSAGRDLAQQWRPPVGWPVFGAASLVSAQQQQQQQMAAPAASRKRRRPPHERAAAVFPGWQQDAPPSRGRQARSPPATWRNTIRPRARNEDRLSPASGARTAPAIWSSFRATSRPPPPPPPLPPWASVRALVAAQHGPGLPHSSACAFLANEVALRRLRRTGMSMPSQCQSAGHHGPQKNLAADAEALEDANMREAEVCLVVLAAHRSRGEFPASLMPDSVLEVLAPTLATHAAHQTCAPRAQRAAPFLRRAIRLLESHAATTSRNAARAWRLRLRATRRLCCALRHGARSAASRSSPRRGGPRRRLQRGHTHHAHSSAVARLPLPPPPPPPHHQTWLLDKTRGSARSARTPPPPPPLPCSIAQAASNGTEHISRGRPKRRSSSRSSRGGTSSSRSSGKRSGRSSRTAPAAARAAVQKRTKRKKPHHLARPKRAREDGASKAAHLPSRVRLPATFTPLVPPHSAADWGSAFQPRAAESATACRTRFTRLAQQLHRRYPAHRQNLHAAFVVACAALPPIAAARGR